LAFPRSAKKRLHFYYKKKKRKKTFVTGGGKGGGDKSPKPQKGPLRLSISVGGGRKKRKVFIFIQGGGEKGKKRKEKKTCGGKMQIAAICPWGGKGGGRGKVSSDIRKKKGRPLPWGEREVAVLILTTIRSPKNFEGKEKGGILADTKKGEASYYSILEGKGGEIITIGSEKIEGERRGPLYVPPPTSRERRKGGRKTIACIFISKKKKESLFTSTQEKKTRALSRWG